MVRVVLIALAGAAVWYGWKVFQRQQGRVGAELRQAEAKLRGRQTVSLERDPKTGVYRPSNRPD